MSLFLQLQPHLFGIKEQKHFRFFVFTVCVMERHSLHKMIVKTCDNIRHVWWCRNWIFGLIANIELTTEIRVMHLSLSIILIIDVAVVMNVGSGQKNETMDTSSWNYFLCREAGLFETFANSGRTWSRVSAAPYLEEPAKMVWASWNFPEGSSWLAWEFSLSPWTGWRRWRGRKRSGSLCFCWYH